MDKIKGLNKKERYKTWQTAIGLQQVDGLEPSQYLIENAKENIEGRVSIYEIKERLNTYYETKSSRNKNDRVEEADKVSTRIVEILSEKTFNFTPIELISIHKRLFSGILNGHKIKAKAGVIRNYNISKKEWVLNGESVYYTNAKDIMDTLKYDFSQEKSYKYSNLSKEKIVEHIAQFISGIWQIHAFGEGNTRTIAVFTIKYLRSLGYKVNNELFEKNSWYFRNALVRANYNDYSQNVYSTFEYLNYFFDNLLLNKKHKLKNRDLLIKSK